MCMVLAILLGRPEGMTIHTEMGMACGVRGSDVGRSRRLGGMYLQRRDHRRLSRSFAGLEEYFSTVFKRILIVCIGNICRSPTAEYLLRQHLVPRDIQLGSAGLGALVGSRMDAAALHLLAEHGIDGTAHRARQLTPAMLREADLVLGMEKGHVDAMTRLAPETSGKIFLLDKWLLGRDIPDPYRQQREAFDHVYGMIRQGVDSWLRYL
ncbi:low molecular weight protein-tyrosine-phosphatase [Rhodanobacter sp. C05]|uniref:low molecular weight protein-tyrosine-phosphatase n=1 Tax=Rhodanobacter sp. C05 TaxID=1945855 RepID=UPI0026BCA525